MKNYRLLIPIALVLLYVVSVYKVINENVSKNNEYRQYVEAARENAEKEINVNAMEYYQKALNLKPSLELSLEVGEFYKKTQSKSKVIEWGSQMLGDYPHEVAAYKFMMDAHIEENDFIACFRLYDTLKKRGLQSKEMEQIIEGIKYEYYFTGEYENVSVYGGGCCAVQVNGLWGYVNEAGEKIISNMYVEQGTFVNGEAPVVNEQGEAYYIDLSGNKIGIVDNVEGIEKLGMKENDTALLYNGSDWGYYKTDGTPVITGFEEATELANGYMVAKKNGSWGIYNSNGEQTSKATYDEVVVDEKNIACRLNRLFVKDGVDYRLIDTEGNIYGKEAYEDAKLFCDATYAAVKKNEKWGFIDENGSWIIEPEYEDARSFSNGFAAVKKNGLWGFINSNNEVCIDFTFENAKDFNSRGSVFVYNYDTWSLLRLYSYNY